MVEIRTISSEVPRDLSRKFSKEKIMKREYKDTGYFVDTEGNIYSKRDKGKILVLAETHKGYYRCGLSLPDGKRTISAHRMVAITFIPNPDNLPEVNHIDGDKKNNSVQNLEWVTSKQNKRHAMEVLGSGFGETHSCATITTEDVHTICRMIEQGYRTVDIVKTTNIGIDKVRSIKKGGTWRHISKSYVFPKGKSDHGMSDSTFLWVCHQLQDGVSGLELIRKYTGGCKLSPQTVSNIKTRKLRPELSAGFNF